MPLTHFVAHILLQTAPPSTAITVDLPGLLTSFLALAGAAAATAALVNAGKFFKLIPDGAAPNVSLVLNLIGFVVLTVVRLFRPDFDVAGADAVLATVATVLTSVLALLSQLGVSKLVNNGIKDIPVIGFSYSRQIEKEKTARAQLIAFRKRQ